MGHRGEASFAGLSLGGDNGLSSTPRLGLSRGVAAFAALLSVALVVLVFASSAQASKGGRRLLWQSGGAGGQFNALGAAGNRYRQLGCGRGDVYLVDGGNNRIERFDEDGKFIRAWGLTWRKR